MKYRVKQLGSDFYPQHRNMLGFWSKFYVDEGFYDRVVYFSNLDSAKRFISETIPVIYPYP